MVYIENWDDFQKAVEDLYVNAANRTRYASKYRHVDGLLTLKVTDDVTCLKYRTNQFPDLRKFDKLNKWLLEKMTQRTVRPPPEPIASEGGPSLQQTTPASPAKAQGKKRKGKK
ncbi:hypothetical protein SeMB42_g00171 [Synchytrium endobioticum]|uniref:Signal recognition particle 9 kDa protein n=1 Tax=Synchytrium endobioticum TaxID=286115 RepID=A0A507DSA4_9FUNG|nr:hypothetical protein SeMB42_g00171 [Synchytrium endobioticum]